MIVMLLPQPAIASPTHFDAFAAKEDTQGYKDTAAHASPLLSDAIGKGAKKDFKSQGSGVSQAPTANFRPEDSVISFSAAIAGPLYEGMATSSIRHENNCSTRAELAQSLVHLGR
eukprot:5192034-Karenia_brevis.AAC.1